jgi:hypothetical protein
MKKKTDDREPDTCAYCGAKTWCGYVRGKPQCRACGSLEDLTCDRVADGTVPREFWGEDEYYYRLEAPAWREYIRLREGEGS